MSAILKQLNSPLPDQQEEALDSLGDVLQGAQALEKDHLKALDRAVAIAATASAYTLQESALNALLIAYQRPQPPSADLNAIIEVRDALPDDLLGYTLELLSASGRSEYRTIVQSYASDTRDEIRSIARAAQ